MKTINAQLSIPICLILALTGLSNEVKSFISFAWYALLEGNVKILIFLARAALLIF